MMVWLIICIWLDILVCFCFLLGNGINYLNEESLSIAELTLETKSECHEEESSHLLSWAGCSSPRSSLGGSNSWLGVCVWGEQGA